MQTKTASVTTLTNASDRSILVASATVRVRFTSADVLTSLLVTVTAMAANLTLWEFVEALVTSTLTRMAFVTLKMNASEPWNGVVSAMVRERFTLVDVPRFQQGIVIVLVIS